MVRAGSSSRFTLTELRAQSSSWVSSIENLATSCGGPLPQHPWVLADVVARFALPVHVTNTQDVREAIRSRDTILTCSHTTQTHHRQNTHLSNCRPMVVRVLVSNCKSPRPRFPMASSSMPRSSTSSTPFPLQPALGDSRHSILIGRMTGLVG